MTGSSTPESTNAGAARQAARSPSKSPRKTTEALATNANTPQPNAQGTNDSETSSATVEGEDDDDESQQVTGVQRATKYVWSRDQIKKLLSNMPKYRSAPARSKTFTAET
ncbi:hypothetical protein V5O48_019153 [Marasmius crinis-equi]|uniref:Uncharacterized protein n=1 Tax=Marasmius crinis-equi TaxID=585013 RepID=A0ABR3EJA0_9AGAR